MLFCLSCNTVLILCYTPKNMSRYISWFLGSVLFPVVLSAQPGRKPVYTVRISGNYRLVFLEKNPKTHLYSHPRLLLDGRMKKIKGYSEFNFADEKVQVSANKRYLVMDHIIQGYVHDGTDSTWHENYTCVIVDTRKQQVVHTMQSDCSGEWNNKNQWISADKVIFDGNQLK